MLNKLRVRINRDFPLAALSLFSHFSLPVPSHSFSILSWLLFLSSLYLICHTRFLCPRSSLLSLSHSLSLPSLFSTLFLHSLSTLTHSSYSASLHSLYSLCLSSLDSLRLFCRYPSLCPFSSTALVLPTATFTFILFSIAPRDQGT